MFRRIFLSQSFWSQVQKLRRARCGSAVRELNRLRTTNSEIREILEIIEIIEISTNRTQLFILLLLLLLLRHNIRCQEHYL